MSEFYDQLQATADQLIKQFGKPIPATLTRTQITTHNKVLNSVVVGVPLSTPISIVVLPATTSNVGNYDNRIKEGSIGLERIRFVIASAVGVTFEPKPKDTLEFDDEKWEVLGCTPVKPSDTAVLYKMGVMK